MEHFQLKDFEFDYNKNTKHFRHFTPRAQKNSTHIIKLRENYLKKIPN